MKLYTKRGDGGFTDLIGGERAPKSDPRVCAYGGVDETNAAIGMAVAACSDDDTSATLRRIQSDLFVLGAELATQAGQQPKSPIGEAHVTQLEHWIDEASAELAPSKEFVLPGGSEAAARLHIARTVCRRAERATIALAREQSVGSSAKIYLNRLSDLLFVLARRANHRAGVADVPWERPER